MLVETEFNIFLYISIFHCAIISEKMVVELPVTLILIKQLSIVSSLCLLCFPFQIVSHSQRNLYNFSRSYMVIILYHVTQFLTGPNSFENIKKNYDGRKHKKLVYNNCTETSTSNDWDYCRYGKYQQMDNERNFDNVNITNICAKFVPNYFTQEQKDNHLDICFDTNDRLT